MDRVHQHKIEERDVAAEQQHRDNGDEGRIKQLLVSLDSFFLWIPRPGSLLKLDLNFVEKVFRFSNHGTMSIFVIVDLAGKSRQEGLEPPTGGFGDRYSTN